VAQTEGEQRIATVRRFNRFYTKQIGLLGEGYLETPFSLTEARVLYELAHRERPSATELARELALDQGYLSRILRGFERRRLLTRTRSRSDGRQSHLALTARGRAAFAPLDQRSREDIAAMLARLAADEQRRLIDAIRTVESILGGEPERKAPYVLRPHQPGDMGWVVHRHGALYAREYGFDVTFEALVARTLAEFAPRRTDRDRLWIAERGGDIVGSIAIVGTPGGEAQLRWYLVDPSARGQGLGTRLLHEAVAFCRRRGYDYVFLRSVQSLTAAAHLFRSIGFEKVEERPSERWGVATIEEWYVLHPFREEISRRQAAARGSGGTRG